MSSIENVPVVSPYPIPTSAATPGGATPAAGASPEGGNAVLPQDAFAASAEEGKTPVAVRVGASLLGALALVGMAGCSGPSQPPPPEVSQSQVATPAEQSRAEAVRPGVAIYDGTRLDIIRQTESETDSDGHSQTRDVDLSPFGVDLGDGLFLDLNGNLSYEMAPGMVVRDPHHLEYTVPSLLGPKASVTVDQTPQGTVIRQPSLIGGPATWRISQQGNDTVIEEPTLFGGPARTTIHREGNVTTISKPGLGGPYEVARVIDAGGHTEVRQPALGRPIVTTIDHAGATTTIKQPALFKPVVTTIEQKSNEIMARYPGGSTTIRRIDNERTVVEHRGFGTATAEIHRHDNTLEISHPTLVGKSPVVTITTGMASELPPP